MFSKSAAESSLRDATVVGVLFKGLKGFSTDEHQSLPLAPLTLVFGPNSGGKSTVLKATANLAQTLRQNRATAETLDWWGSGPWFDFGNGREILHREPGARGPASRSRSFSLGFDLRAGPELHRILYTLRYDPPNSRYNISSVEHLCGSRIHDLDLRSRWKSIRRKPPGTPTDWAPIRYFMPDLEVSSPEMDEINGWVQELADTRQMLLSLAEKAESRGCKMPKTEASRLRKMRKSLRPMHLSRDDFLTIFHWKEGELELGHPDTSGGPESDESQSAEQVQRVHNRKLLVELKVAELLETEVGQFLDQEDLTTLVTTHPRLLELRDVRRSGDPPLQREVLMAMRSPYVLRVSRQTGRRFQYLSLLSNLTLALRTWMSQITYQPATRLVPKRYYSSDLADRDTARIPGQNALSLLFKNPQLLEQANELLNRIVDLKIQFARLYAELPRPGKKGGRRAREETKFFQVRVCSDDLPRGVELPDVGYGVSQLIPLITASLSPGTLFVEEPESNLHPRAQARVMEVMVDGLNSTLKDSNSDVHPPSFVIETHSEHMLKRLVQLLREGRIADEHVAILYVWSEHGRTQWKRIRTDQGEILDRISEDFHSNPTSSVI